VFDVDSMVAETARTLLPDLLRRFSVEVLPKDNKSIDSAPALLEPRTEVFVASLPNEGPESLIAACARLGRDGLAPVPHLAARNIRSRPEFEDMVARLAGEAGVDRALILGGDRDDAVGPFDASLQLIETGLLQANGIRRVFLAAHPEGHPRVSDAILWPALKAKLDACAAGGLEASLVTQFAFEAQPFLTLARRLRADGIAAPLRVGVAGPAARTTLIKYALMCGVGPSLRALRERQALAKNVAAGETPEALLRELARAQADEPSLGIDSVHFFTFASLQRSADFVAEMRRG
jgi:methylenetetrahydrofolate reductase (NADPH)